MTLKMCLVQLRAETLTPNVAGAVRAKEVNSDPRAMREEEEFLQISQCALLQGGHETGSAGSLERSFPSRGLTTRQGLFAAGCQLGHMSACPFFRSVMRHSFLSPRRIT